MASLATRFTVICPDLMGFGQSPKPRDRAYGLPDHAALVTECLRARDLQDVTVVGHSFDTPAETTPASPGEEG